MNIENSLSEQYIAIDMMRENSKQHGWLIKYLKPEAGQLPAESFTWQCGQISLMYESMNRCSQVVVEPPPGMLAILVPDSNEPMSFNGQWLDDRQMIVVSPGNKIQLIASRRSQVVSMHIPISLVTNGFSDSELWQGGSLELNSTKVISDKVAVAHLRCLMLHSRTPRSPGKWLLTTEQSLIANVQHLLAVHCMNSTGSADRVNLGRAFRLTKLDLFLDSNLQNQIPMSEITGIVCMSERAFERFFKNEFEMTPSEYIKLRRLERARGELAKMKFRQKSIAQIAMDNGFRHLGRFSRIFREHFGQTPSQFRKTPGKHA